MNTDKPNKDHVNGGVSDNNVAADEDQAFVDPRHLNLIAAKYEKDHVATRKWLLSYKPLKPGTEVSLRFLLDDDHYPTEPPHSLLPVFTRCLHAWFSRSIKENQERSGVSWLLEYVAQYIQVGHSKLDHDELNELCDELLYVSSNARHYIHIERCLAVFLAIIQEAWFPRECLVGVLSVLSSAIIILDKSPEQIEECVVLLASNALAKETITTFYDQLRAIRENQRRLGSSPDLHKYLTPARGAIRHLRKVLSLQDQNEKFVIDIDELLPCLSDASQARLMRLSTEMLGLCYDLLTTGRCDDIKTDNQLDMFLQILRNCVDSEIVPDTNDIGLINSVSTKEEPTRRERRYRREHEIALGELTAEIAEIHDHWPESRQSQLYRVFRLSATKLKTAGVHFMLRHATTHRLCYPETEGWEEELFLMFDTFVARPNLETDVRLAAIGLCRDVLLKLTKGDFDEDVKRVVSTGVNRFLSCFPTESDAFVMREVAHTLCQLAICIDHTGANPHATHIIDTVKSRILKLGGKEKISDEALLEGARAIRRVLLHSPQASTSAQAFDALVLIAGTKCQSRRSRIAAMRILLRIRCDVNGNAYIDVSSTSMHIASALCRTEESQSYMIQDASTSSLPSLLNSSSHETQDPRLWSYPDEMDDDMATWQSSELIGISIKDKSLSPPSNEQIRITDWLFVVLETLQEDKDWETYSYMLVHIAAQLVNMKLFMGSLEAVTHLRKILCHQVMHGSVFEPPRETGLKKSDVALCIYHVLSGLIPYSRVTSPHVQIDAVGFGNDLVKAFSSGIAGLYEGTARGCIHALSLCCFEVPQSIASEYPSILDKLVKSMTQSHLVAHILEFLAQVARLPELHANFTGDEVKIIFGMCTQFLEKTRAKANTADALPPRSATPARHTGLTLRRPPYRAAMLQEKGLPQYSSALAFHTMIFWFLSLNLSIRSKVVPFLVPRLIWRTNSHEESIDEQSEVFIDMMQRAAFSDLGEPQRPAEWASLEDGPINSASWVVGYSIVTIETAGYTGKSLITKRQAAGTTYSVVSLQSASLPPHHVPSWTSISTNSDDKQPVWVLPSHLFLQQVATAAATPLKDLPISLPQEDYVRRGIESVDRCPALDSHKVGVIGIRAGQATEQEYLSNLIGTADFNYLLRKLGAEMSLMPPLQFNAQGLHHESDGNKTIAWRDRVNEIVFLVPQFMPNPDDDPHLIRKKSLVGNSHVLIVFNQSKAPWVMSNFSSQVTMCHIVITPVDRSTDPASDEEEHDFFQVEVLTKEEFQNISAAAEPKVVSKETLAPFVRMIALNANIFSLSQVAADAGDDEFPSSWRERLKSIKRLRAQTQSRVIESRQDTLASRYDFDHWTPSG